VVAEEQVLVVRDRAHGVNNAEQRDVDGERRHARQRFAAVWTRLAPKLVHALGDKRGRQLRYTAHTPQAGAPGLRAYSTAPRRLAGALW